jgi:ABC-2 type transport system permease protein
MSGARESFERVRAIAYKELLHLRRDRLTLGMVVFFPLVATLIFGLAINQDVRNLSAGVADLAGTQRARQLVLDAEASQVIDLERNVHSAEALEELLVEGEIAVGILIPRDFERRVATRQGPPAQLMVDGADPIVLGAARGLTALPIPGQARAPQPSAVPSFELRAYFNPERRSPVFIVPGLCGLILTLTMVLFTSVALVRERERGNLEMLITTPIRAPELMLGKILPYIAIGYVQITLILLLALFFFRVPLVGSLVDFYVGAGAFVAAMLTLGLIFSTIAQTQFQAFQMAFMSFMPQILLSGFMFPFDGMPRPFQWLAELLPLTHFIRIARGVLLRGATLGQLWPEIWPLLAIFAGLLALSVLRFRKRLD